MWQNWINGFLGIWLLVLAIFQHTGSWTVGVTGLAVSVLAFWTVNVMKEREEPPTEINLPHHHELSQNIE